MIRRRGTRWPNELSSRMPVTMPKPSGSTTTTKSFGLEAERVACAKRGPNTPSTPTSEAASARYVSDQPIDRWPRMNVDPLAQLGEGRAHRLLGVVGHAAVRPRASSVEVGGAGGSVQQNPAATR